MERIAALDGIALVAIGPTGFSESMGIRDPSDPRLRSKLNQLAADVEKVGKANLQLPTNHPALPLGAKELVESGPGYTHVAPAPLAALLRAMRQRVQGDTQFYRTPRLGARQGHVYYPQPRDFDTRVTSTSTWPLTPRTIPAVGVSIPKSCQGNLVLPSTMMASPRSRAFRSKSKGASMPRISSRPARWVSTSLDSEKPVAAGPRRPD